MYNYPVGCVQRPGWVLFTSRGQVGGLCTGGCRGNCSDRPARVSLCALCARLSCFIPSVSGERRTSCGNVLVSSARPLLESLTYHRFRPLASFCGYLLMTLPGHSFPAGHAKHGATPQACSTGREAASPGLGGTPTSVPGYPKGYPGTLLAAVTFCPGASNHHTKILSSAYTIF